MNKHPLRPIGAEDDIARFNEDGAICIRNVFDQEWCKRMNAAVERLLHDPGSRAREATKAGDPGRFHMNVFMWRWDPDFRDFALNSPLPELAATLLKQDRVSLFYDQAFIKEPGTREVTQWHQDLPFWPALGNDIVSLWVALTPVTVEGSGVEYVAGSHRWGKFYQAITPDQDAKFTNASLESCPDFTQLKVIHNTGSSPGIVTRAMSSAIIRSRCMVLALIHSPRAVRRFQCATRDATRAGIRGRM